MTQSINLKVLSYNIHKGFNAKNTSFVLDKMRHALMHIDADVLFLQEVQGRHKEKRFKQSSYPVQPDYEFLAGEVWKDAVYGKNAIYRSGHHGNALLSQYPFKSWENTDVSFMKRASRSLLHGVIQLPNTDVDLHVICVHFGLFRVERASQFKTLVKTILEKVPCQAPLIVAGDFNDWQRHAERAVERVLHLEEVFKNLSGHHAKTFPARNPNFTIDRIYYRHLNLLCGQVLGGEPWDKLSDHLPLFAEFSYTL